MESARKNENENRRKVQGVKEPEGEGGYQGVSVTWFPKISNKHPYKIIYNFKCFSGKMNSQ